MKANEEQPRSQGFSLCCGCALVTRLKEERKNESQSKDKKKSSQYSVNGLLSLSHLIHYVGLQPFCII